MFEAHFNTCTRVPCFQHLPHHTTMDMRHYHIASLGDLCCIHLSLRNRVAGLKTYLFYIVYYDL